MFDHLVPWEMHSIAGNEECVQKTKHLIKYFFLHLVVNSGSDLFVCFDFPLFFVH